LKEAEERSISMNPSSGVASKNSNGYKVDQELLKMIDGGESQNKE
jgi:hypothetical protein